VLRLWANQLSVSLSIDSLAAISMTGLGKRVLNQYDAAWVADASLLPWEQAVQHLDLQLTKLKLPVNTKLAITLASELVRYMTLPPQQVYMRMADKQAYAHAAYREVYGATVNDWSIKCQDSPPSKSMLTSAIDKALLKALRQLALKHQLILSHVQPYLMTVFNRLYPHLNQSTALLAVLEPQRVMLVDLLDGNCQQVRSVKRIADWQITLKQLLAREALLNGDKTRNLLLYAPQQKETALNLPKQWKFKRLNIVDSKAKRTSPYTLLEAFV
jgi:hypothetical protein